MPVRQVHVKQEDAVVWGTVDGTGLAKQGPMQS